MGVSNIDECIKMRLDAKNGEIKVNLKNIASFILLSRLNLRLNKRSRVMVKGNKVVNKLIKIVKSKSKVWHRICNI